MDTPDPEVIVVTLEITIPRYDQPGRTCTITTLGWQKAVRPNRKRNPTACSNCGEALTGRASALLWETGAPPRGNMGAVVYPESGRAGAVGWCVVCWDHDPKAREQYALASREVT